MQQRSLVAANDESVNEAARHLRAGRLVALPTETVYGLAADATNEDAVMALYRIKDRPRFNPLIVHVLDLKKAREIGEFDALSEALAKRFWPGPLTLVVRRARHCPVSKVVSAGLDTVALRVPSHPVMRAVLERAGVPLAAPSANPSGGVSPTEARHVAEAMGAEIPLILDGGSCRHGVESTVIRVLEGRTLLLRPGAIPRAEIEAVTGPLVDPNAEEGSSPGRLAGHYAPKTPVRLEATSVDSDECLLAFGIPIAGHPKAVRNLSLRGDLGEAAANLFGHLRALDKVSCRAIAVMPVPDYGLGEAINDRLRRAAETSHKR